MQAVTSVRRVCNVPAPAPPASPCQDQERLERVEQHELKPLVALGEGGFGSVNLCRVPASSSTSAFAALGAQQGGTPDRTSPAAAQPEAEDGADSEQRQADSSASTSGSGDVQVKVRPSLNDPQLIVAVKRVPLGWNQERELMQLHRCQQCPFIVRLFGFVEDGGGEHCSYIMEWAEGGDLGGLLQVRDGRICGGGGAWEGAHHACAVPVAPLRGSLSHSQREW